MTKLDKYEMLEEIGRGGFATVYRAQDTRMGREVALKVIGGNLVWEPAFVERFRQEARVAANLRHPNIVPVYDFGESDGALYLAMALIGDGRTLRSLLAEGTPLPLERALPLLAQIAEALDYLHGQGLVHRDLKPANVLLEGEADKPRAILTDFGLVRSLESSTKPTQTGSIFGTPTYMAPEQADTEKWGEITPLTDVYALGVLAYELLVGRPPFESESPLAVLRAHADKHPPPPWESSPDLSIDLAKVLLKALNKAPADRYSSAGEFVAQLRNAPLYERLQAAFGRKDWTEVLEVGGQIRAVAPDYRDVPDLMSRARRQLERPRLIPTPPSALRRAPRWIWGVGGVGLIVLLALLCLGLGSLVPGLWPSPGPTVTEIAELPTATGGMVMVYVPAGTFQMGSDERDPNADADEKPRHQVTLDAFLIDKYEVSNAQYTRCVEAGACQKAAYADDATYNGADYPVVGVSWYDATDYCQWVGGRLPTEAEWEYVARGPDVPIIYPWGDTFECSRVNADDETVVDSYVVSGGAGCDGYDRTAPVSSFSTGASWVGALNMAGNVWEWVNDWYDRDYYASSPRQNPRGPETGASRVLRGGSWYYVEEFVRAATRNDLTADYRSSDIGFRCVVEPSS